jgi:uncharacterized peroxidase-related enzyme
MASLALVGDDVAATRAAFEGVRKRLGTVPNLFRVVGNAPAVLNGYLAFAGSFGKGAVSPALGERIAIAVAEADGCEYCLAAHAAIGAGAGLSEDAIAAAQAGTAADPRDAAAIAFARAVLANQGRAPGEDLARVRAAGWDDAAIVEIIAQVAVNVFTNTVNNVARTPIDFPARRLRRAA